MALISSKFFARAALPLVLGLTPLAAQAECRNDRFDFGEKLEIINVTEMDLRPDQRHVLETEPSSYNRRMMFLSMAAHKTAQDIIDQVMDNYIGNIDPDIPAYPMLDEAKAAMLCVMDDLTQGRIVTQDRQIIYREYHRAFLRLMTYSANSAEELRENMLEVRTLSQRGDLHSDYMIIDDVEFMANLILRNHDIITAHAERAQGVASFIAEELQIPTQGLDLDPEQLRRIAARYADIRTVSTHLDTSGVEQISNISNVIAREF